MCLSLLIFFSSQILSPEENKRTKHSELPRKDTLEDDRSCPPEGEQSCRETRETQSLKCSNQAVISSTVLCVKHSY